MLHLIAQNLAPLMFFSIMLLLLLGFPVAFTLAAGGLAFFALGTALSGLAPGDISLAWPLLQAQPDRIFGIVSNDVLLAVPFFTLMGAIFEKTGIAEELLATVARLFGSLRGGLCYAVILVGALLAATTGVVSASVMTMGLIALPIMLRSGYHPHLAAGVITASGTLSQIVPPSLVLIVMADQVMVPVGEIYRGALVPSALLIGAYLLAILVLSVLFPKMVPASAEAAPARHDYLSFVLLALPGIAVGLAGHLVFTNMDSGPRTIAAIAAGGVTSLLLAWLDGIRPRPATSNFARQAVLAIVPTLGLIFLVLGTIFLGVATPTESGALGATGALLLALVRGRMSKADLTQTVERTARLTVFVFFILIGAKMFSLTFYGLGGDEWLHRELTSLPGGRTGFIVITMILIFVLGCFLDFFEIAFIVIPLLLPTAYALDIDPLWFALIISINLQTSFLTPPFGFALFYLRSVTTTNGPNRLSNEAIYYGALGFIAINVVVMGLLIAFPELISPPTPDFVPGAENAVDFGTRSSDFGAPASGDTSQNLNDIFK
ncbi:TRAP transporter large permease [Chachezhania sediminis]|uniref:TRAP transporter large permease n=1 Tax=Chachezhania sediminis TaxID=2599291 RepID=UPI00131DEB93|nr:TRAP transporter large permease subunit [Chachezhania sediminis]